MTYNVNNLKEHLIKIIGPNIISSSLKNPNKKDEILLNKDLLLNYFTDNKIKVYAEKHWISLNNLSIDKFIDFLINHANSNNTRGKYHEYMDFHPSLFNLNVDRGIPDYDSMTDLTIKNKIKNNRVEYIPCFWIVNKIRNHTFLSKFLDLTLPKFQHVLSTVDNRFYDIYFEKLKIIIEVQEDASHHLENNNDILKDSLAICRDNFILYFKIQTYKEKHINYLNEFWNELYEHILASLFEKQDIREKYVIYKFIELCKHKIDDLNICLKTYKKINNQNKIISTQNEIKLIKGIIKTDPDNIITTIFKWKDSSQKNKYCITLEDVFLIIGKEYTDENINFYLQRYPYTEKNDDEDYYLTWETMMTLISISDINIAEKHKIIYYLVSVQEIYEDICSKIIYDGNERRKAINLDIVQNHIKDQLEKNYKNKLSSLEKENGILKEEHKLLQNKIKKTVSASEKCLNKITKTNKNKTDIESLVQELKSINQKYSQDYLTVNLEDIGESIFIEIPDFPILYSRHSYHQITFCQFDAICNDWNIPKLTRSLFIERLFGCKNTNPHVLNYLQVNKYQQKTKNDNEELDDDISSEESDDDRELDDDSEILIETKTNLVAKSETISKSKPKSKKSNLDHFL
jgi:hypothetical protein